MAGLSWLSPPPVVVIGGTETFLRDREVTNAIRTTAKSGRDVTRARTEAEAIDAISSTLTFGSPCLITLDASLVSEKTVAGLLESKPPKTCLLLIVNGAIDEKKIPALALVHNGFRATFMVGATRKEQKDLAVRFAQVEATRLLNGNKDALDTKLAEALVNAVGTDLGMISFELVKVAAYCRSLGTETILSGYVKALIRPSAETDMGPLREALKSRNRRRVAAALEKIRRVAQDDPVMLLLRAKGGPADLALTWLRAAVLLERGIGASEIATRLSVPEWIVGKDIIPAARTWGSRALRRMISNLADVDRGVLRGIPAPWVSCETALLLDCQD